MPLPLTISCFSKIQIGFTFLVPADLGNPGKRAVKRVCVCVSFAFILIAVIMIKVKWLKCLQIVVESLTSVITFIFYYCYFIPFVWSLGAKNHFYPACKIIMPQSAKVSWNLEAFGALGIDYMSTYV